LSLYIRISLFIWELPQILLAIMIIILLRRKIVKNESYKRARIIYIKSFPGGISLGKYIILNEKHYGRKFLKKHEYGHSIQSLYLGWFYLAVVGIPSIIRAFIWRSFKLNLQDYYKGYPENWANRLGAIRKKRMAVV